MLTPFFSFITGDQKEDPAPQNPEDRDISIVSISPNMLRKHIRAELADFTSQDDPKLLKGSCKIFIFENLFPFYYLSLNSAAVPLCLAVPDPPQNQKRFPAGSSENIFKFQKFLNFFFVKKNFCGLPKTYLKTPYYSFP